MRRRAYFSGNQPAVVPVDAQGTSALHGPGPARHLSRSLHAAYAGRHFELLMHSLKTYIVEDSPVIRDNLIATLQELTSVEVVGCADDEHTAVDWLSRSGHEARLVIVDIFLKSGSGLGVLQTSAAASGDERKWVVFSNYATDEMRNRCLALGADRVFDKSTEIDALIDYCEQLSSGASSRPGTLE